LDATRAPCPGLKHQRGTDFGQGRITAKTGSVQACLRHDWQFATDSVPDGYRAMNDREAIKVMIEF
jgi:hypothetical protein